MMTPPDPAREAAREDPLGQRVARLLGYYGVDVQGGNLAPDRHVCDELLAIGNEAAELRAQLTAARARAERAEEDASGSWECLMMASEILAAFLGPDHMKGVPPMFYPEAIRSLVYKSARAGILAVFREQATVPTEAEIKRLLQQARALILHQQSDADRAASIPQGAAT